MANRKISWLLEFVFCYLMFFFLQKFFFLLIPIFPPEVEKAKIAKEEAQNDKLKNSVCRV